MPVTLKAALLGILTASFGALLGALPSIATLEQDVGLDWLFRLRGPRPAPPEVVVASIDRASSRWFHLPNEPRKWPRSYHAALVDRLAERGVRSVAFDIIFDEPRESEADRLLAEALRGADNVVLSQYLTKETRTAGAGHTPPIEVQRLLSPIPSLAEAAAALAPFPLPKVPAKVSQVWTFKTGAGGVPTLPVVAFALYLRDHWDELCATLNATVSDTPSGEACAQDSTRNAATFARSLHELFRSHPGLGAALSARLTGLPEPKRAPLARLIALFQGPDHRYLDLYGPPQSIHTIPYYQLIRGTPTLDLQDKAVFVGFSEQLQPEQKDGFYTVFSQEDGLDVSGVEIAATTFGNLLEGRHVRPLPPLPHLGVTLVWGLAVGGLLMALPGAAAVLASGALAASGLGLAYLEFTRTALWLPLVVPLLFQLPFALVGALLWHYLATRRERRRIREAFGYFLPDRIVDEAVRNTGDLAAGGQLVYGICLSTDAEQYTRLSEAVPPAELRALLNRYFEILFEPVKRHGGLVCDVVGDAMMATWAAPRMDPSLRLKACQAALEMLDAVAASNCGSPESRLPTRIGLHGGEILLGNVGAEHHYEYRPIGDIVNTASRIQGLNKHLGTRVLASREVVEGLDELLAREVGSFRMVGKTRPLVIHELMGYGDHAPASTQALLRDFAIALGAFREARWGDAQERFQGLIRDHKDDGPSRFYLRLCERYVICPPGPAWDGVVALSQK
jgi:adenylate cyclase